MRECYKGNDKIVIYGTKKEIEDARRMLDSIPELSVERTGYRLTKEGKLRLQIQEAMESWKLNAKIMVDGNEVYPYSLIIKEFQRLKKKGTLEKMTKRFYHFLSMNFDIAHCDKQGYIDFYRNDFYQMYNSVLSRANVPGWHTDLQKILDTIWLEMGERDRKILAA